MTCFEPLVGYFGKDVNPETGRRPLVFQRRDSHSGVKITVPCGKCSGCILERSRQWAMRCIHEKRMHSQSAFVTLTYADASLPPNGSLVKRDLQLFMKRLRKERAPGLRFFACGEYGETTFRPHYHLLLFNTDFADKRFHKHASAGHNLYVSKELERIWSLGLHEIGDVTFESCAYVARYCLKKVGSVGLAGREPEFTTKSLRPGLGYEWFKQFGVDAYRHDSAIVDGREVPLPRYYDEKFGLLDEKRLERIKRKRRLRAMTPEARADNTLRRKRVKEKLLELNAARFKRDVS